jgi:hypothetical protein
MAPVLACCYQISALSVAPFMKAREARIQARFVVLIRTLTPIAFCRHATSVSCESCWVVGYFEIVPAVNFKVVHYLLLAFLDTISYNNGAFDLAVPCN